jgi:RNA-directed DNA polymerase
MKVKHKIKLMTKRKTTLPSVHDKIEALNYLLRGWGNYFRHSAASATLDYVGSYAFQRMDHWLRKKTGKRQRALYRRYYRRCERGYVTFIDNGMALFHPGVELKISYYRWRNLPNPYLDNPEDVRLPYHLDPLGGKEWSGDHAYGSTWTETRAMVRQRDSSRCVHCGSAQRVEVHHLRLHQPNRKHNPLKLVSLCRTCHNKARNPRSEVSRTLSRLHFVTGEPDDAKVSRPVREEA